MKRAHYRKVTGSLSVSGQLLQISFIVAPCILIYVEFTHQQMRFYKFKKHIKIYIKIHVNKYRSYMFRSSTIIREIALNLDKVIFILKHLVKLRRYLLCGCVAARCHTTA